MNCGSPAAQSSPAAAKIEAAASGNRKDFGDAGSARDGNVFARGGNRGCSDNVRVIASRFRGVDGGIDGADFAQAHLRNGIEEAGIDLQSFRVNYLSARGNFHGGANCGDLAVTDHQRSIFDRRAREREDLCVRNRVDGRRLCLRASGRSAKKTNQTKKVEEIKRAARTARPGGLSLFHSAPPRVAPA